MIGVILAEIHAKKTFHFAVVHTNEGWRSFVAKVFDFLPAPPPVPVRARIKGYTVSITAGNSSTFLHALLG